MRAATRPGGDYRGRHNLTVLASFRPTWRQALSHGLTVAAGVALLLGIAVLLVVLAPTAVDGLTAGVRAEPGRTGWFAVGIPLGCGAVAVLAVRQRPGARLDEAGAHPGGLRSAGFTPWRQVVDVRAERRRGRTVVVVYSEDGAARRLRVPYDGHLLGRDPRFEQKLFMICHIWSTHRDWSVRG